MVRRTSTRASAMRTTAFATILAVLAPHAAHAGAFEATDKNFDSAVMKSGKHAFVKFLAPWCVFVVDARSSMTRVLFLFASVVVDGRETRASRVEATRLG